MALSELDVERVQRWCATRVPEHARDQLRIECEVAPRHLTLVEPAPALARRHPGGLDQLRNRSLALQRH
ncbi:DUF3024 domain-containing protein [Kribbella sp. NPDC054772]